MILMGKRKDFEAPEVKVVPVVKDKVDVQKLVAALLELAKALDEERT